MIRWIAFDDETAEAVVSRFKRGAAEIHRGQALDAALHLGRPSLLLLPSDTPGRLLLARLEPKGEQASKTSQALGSKGFGELLDRPDFTQRRQPRRQEPAKNKKWWQRRSA
jgi:hypothetical protein